MQQRGLHAKLNWKTDSWISVAGQPAKKLGELGRSQLASEIPGLPTCLTSPATRKRLCCLLHSRVATIFDLVPARAVRGKERPVNTKKKDRKTLWERIGAADHAIRLLSLRFFSLLHALRAKSRQQTLGDVKLLRSKQVRQLQLIVRAALFALVLLSYGCVQPLHFELLVAECLKAIELDDGRDVVRRPDTVAEIGLC